MHTYHEKDVVDVLKSEGPLTGRELESKLGVPYEQRMVVTNLWALCTLSQQIHLQKISNRYLRIDRQTGDLYLSPSVPREFSDFTVVGLDLSGVAEKAERMKEHYKEVGDDKRHAAKAVVTNAMATLQHPNAQQYFCFLLGGDLVYGMASDAQREAVNGEIVQGSDIDIIILHSEIVNSGLIGLLDNALLAQKLRLGRPPYREEMDYKLKGFEAVEEQSAMDSPIKVIACKILVESEFLYGNVELHQRAIGLLKQMGVLQKLKEMKEIASVNREEYERRLLAQFS